MLTIDMGKKSKRKTKTKPPVMVDDVRITADAYIRVIITDTL